MQNIEKTDVLIVGGGASGLLAAIAAARSGVKVLVVEKMKRLGLKILASGGERCNVTNTLDQATYVEDFGKQGRFMIPALDLLGSENLREMFTEFGIETKCRDGFRYFPSSHKSQTVLDGLLRETEKLGVQFEMESKVVDIESSDIGWVIKTDKNIWHSRKVIIATGGLTYQALGSTGDGYRFAESLGHQVVDQHPGGVPIRISETWPGSCRADTIGKAKLSVNMKKHRKISKIGDVIFTNYGIAGPAVLDMSRHITPLIEKYGSLPLTLTLRPLMNHQDWQEVLRGKKVKQKNPQGVSTLDGTTVVELIEDFLPTSIAKAMVVEAGIDPKEMVKQVPPQDLEHLAHILNATPLTAVKSMGYKLAFITRGGVKLKGVHSQTLESKSSSGLYFCGETLDLDGPCGGYNLQWAFASGFLAGTSAAFS